MAKDTRKFVVTDPRHRRRFDILLPTEVVAVYTNYKEPLRPVGDGFGYYGTVATNHDRTHVQCHVCGLYYRNLCKHIAMHGFKAREYREHFGLMMTTPLMGEETRRLYIENYQKRMTPELKDRLRAMAYDINLRGLSGRRRGDTSWTAERRNKAGNCPDQVIDKIKTMAGELGRTPSWGEYQDRYGKGMMDSVKFHYGSWTKAVRHADLIPRQDVLRLDDSALLLAISDWRSRHKRDPLYSDFQTDPTLFRPHVYASHFGGVREARRLAAKVKAAA